MPLLSQLIDPLNCYELFLFTVTTSKSNTFKSQIQALHPDQCLLLHLISSNTQTHKFFDTIKTSKPLTLSHFIVHHHLLWTVHVFSSSIPSLPMVYCHNFSLHLCLAGKWIFFCSHQQRGSETVCIQTKQTIVCIYRAKLTLLPFVIVQRHLDLPDIPH